MIYLCSQISGGLSELYSEMRVEAAKGYQLFKERVKEKFRLTPEHSRREFRKLGKTVEETFSQLGCRLDRL